MTRQFRLLSFGLLFLPSALSCGAKENQTEIKFDSASSLALDAVIENGVLLTDSPNSSVTGQIRDQLNYTVGFLNTYSGVGDLVNRQVTVISTDTTPDSNGLYKVQYRATFHIAWNRRYAVPAQVLVPVPAVATYAGLQRFYDLYSATCSEATHDLSLGSFWYYFRPLNRGCGLAGRTGQEEGAALLSIKTMVSQINTQGRYPEYGKIWEDGKLVATAIFGKYEAGGGSDDYGISAFNRMYALLINNFGRPVQSNVNLPSDVEPGEANPDLQLIFRTPRGSLDVELMLVSSLGGMSQALETRYNERTKISDLVAYNGHSGLGSNIRTLGQMGTFTPGQYQIYYLNGCDTYNYHGMELGEAHRLVNPEALPSKYLDVISTATPSPFGSFASSTSNLIWHLVRQQSTYRQILGNIDGGQTPVVTGEEDNRWPQPF